MLENLTGKGLEWSYGLEIKQKKTIDKPTLFVYFYRIISKM